MRAVRRVLCGPGLCQPVRSAAADESVAAYESECEPEGLYGAGKTIPVRRAFVLAGKKQLTYGARLSLPSRSAASDESEAAYESECRPGGPYGA